MKQSGTSKPPSGGWKTNSSSNGTFTNYFTNLWDFRGGARKGPPFSKKNEMATKAKEKLKDILLDINVAKLSNRYFGRSSSWLYHKFDGTDGRMTGIDFTPEELQMLKAGLIDLSERIRTAAEKL